MLDRDLAMLYGVETRVLNQAVKRNHDRFPNDFMFELTREEIRNISQFVICSSAMKHARNVYAFTEQGVAMLSSVLRSPLPAMRKNRTPPRGAMRHRGSRKPKSSSRASIAPRCRLIVAWSRTRPSPIGEQTG